MSRVRNQTVLHQVRNFRQKVDVSNRSDVLVEVLHFVKDPGCSRLELFHDLLEHDERRQRETLPIPGYGDCEKELYRNSYEQWKHKRVREPLTKGIAVERSENDPDQRGWFRNHWT